MEIALIIGSDIITSYKRLAYKPWYAIAEFVDNSTQSYINNRDILNKIFAQKKETLSVAIVYEPDHDLLRISDNAMGMSYEDLKNALHIARRPDNTHGRSKYGMGLKTAACWIGNAWSIRTKKLGETVEHTVSIDVEKVALQNENKLFYSVVSGKSQDEHYTIIEITNHNQKFQGRTIGKIKEYLSSIYRQDLRDKILKLLWHGTPLVWKDRELLKAIDGSTYKKEFEFDVNYKHINGWVGILESGSRANAGFSIIQYGRVIKGWPDSWRPSTLYGDQPQGSNDLINQRLVGEINLNNFEVSHTKDDILWQGDQEEKVEQELLKACQDYRDFAKDYRKRKDDSRGPSEADTKVALDELKKELLSPEILDQISLEPVPPQNIVDEVINRILQSVAEKVTETFRVDIGDLIVKLYINSDMSPNDPYITVEATKASEVIVIVNTVHPHWLQLKGSDGVLNYLRHCTYDAIAEWKVRRKTAKIHPDTIKLIKDQFLRLPLEIEDNEENENT
ncbi:ATP-binding protein [Nostoc punctiforme FACHB-252]|uniref:ATP-binding protein n=1 Tax=Nostoc punctiforme FACHB-252 TaxID=1357509 RepID=A0ABR8HLU3_NOSPU|nr:ATP-binding protein [Nostoc punctiforme]MBD2616221.1 ATP-binding protein [Nostoc punctiforme FACHB-252]